MVQPPHSHHSLHTIILINFKPLSPKIWTPLQLNSYRAKKFLSFPPSLSACRSSATVHEKWVSVFLFPWQDFVLPRTSAVRWKGALFPVSAPQFQEIFAVLKRNGNIKTFPAKEVIYSSNTHIRAILTWHCTSSRDRSWESSNWNTIWWCTGRTWRLGEGKLRDVIKLIKLFEV